jgi:hypothetical protein
VVVGDRGPDLPDGAGLVGQFVQDVPDGDDGSRWPGCLLAGRRPGGFGECLADHAAVDVVAAGDLPGGHAAGGVIDDDAEQPGLAGRLGFRRWRRAIQPAGRLEPGEGAGERGEGAAADRGEPPQARRQRLPVPDPVSPDVFQGKPQVSIASEIQRSDIQQPAHHPGSRFRGGQY